MSTISAAAVKSLRDRTNLPMMDCKAALVEAQGDAEKAVDILRTKFKGVPTGKAAREMAEGRIAAFVDPETQVGALVEVRCESAPVAKSEQFIQLANDIARQIAIKSPANVDELVGQALVADPKKTINDRIGEVYGMLRENMKPARFTRLTGLLGYYCHHDGSVGAMVQVEGGKADPQLLKDVCMHIVSNNPVAGRREDVPADLVARETEILKKQMENDPKNKGKPANIMEMIAAGKMKTWFADNVLVDQPFVKDDTKTVGELLKAAGLTLVKFVRYKVGELS